MVPRLVIRYRILFVGYICSHWLDRSYIGLPVRSDLPRSLRHMVFRWAVFLSTGNMDFHTSRALTECSHIVLRSAQLDRAQLLFASLIVVSLVKPRT